MIKSYKKLIIFDIIITIFLLLNNFILNILGNYYYIDIFLILILIAFRFIFGFEKDNHRFTKDIFENIIIIYLLSFIIYYIFGILTGFLRTDNYFTLHGISTFILPYIIMIIVKEYLRYQMLTKADKSKILTVVICITFILIDFTNQIANSSLNNSYNVFLFVSLSVLPIISNNIVCTYIAKKNGYKPNIFWLSIAGLYGVLLPIVPNVGLYIESLIKFLFPYVILYNIHQFYVKRSKNIPLSYNRKRVYIELPILAIFVFTLAYYVSGMFRYYAVAVASGSMLPQINVGDIVIVDQKVDYKELAIGEVIAYHYNDIIIIHRLYDIVKDKEDYYFYTKGDANSSMDNYIIYPDTIIGRVNIKIPYIGLPTVWLSKVFNK